MILNLWLRPFSTCGRSAKLGLISLTCRSKQKPPPRMTQDQWREQARIEVIRASTNPYASTSTIEGRMAARTAQSYLPKPQDRSSFPSSLPSTPTISWSPTSSKREGSGLINHVAAGAWWFVERIPPLRWLRDLAELVISLPVKYSWWLAAVGLLVGLLAGVRTGDTTSLIVAIVAGAIAGRILLPLVGACILVVAMFSGLAILLAIVGGCLAAIVFLLDRLAR